MQPLPVVNLLQEITDSTACVFQIAIVSPVSLLLFQRSHKPLCTGVVIWIATPAHADLNLALLQYLCVIARCVLHASIGVMDQLVSFPIASVQCHLQSSNR